MLREPLAHCSQFRTGDLDVIRDVGARLLVPHKVKALGAVSSDARMNAAKLGNTTLAYLRYESRITLEAPTTEALYFFTLPLTGKAEAQRGKHETAPSIPSLGVAYRAEDPSMITLSPDYSMIFVRIERHALERQLEGLLCREIKAPLCFDFSMDLTTPSLRTWVDSVRLLQAEMERDAETGHEPLLVARVEELVMTGLLVGQPHNYSELLLSTHGPARPRVVKQAIDLLEQQPDQPWSISDLSRATGVSARTLQYGFQRYVGVSPTCYLREVRLQRVRAELSNPAVWTSVSDSAYRWGFAHLGRFAVAYRNKFGEAPSETLRKNASRDFPSLTQ
ncbi:hypothetical protein CBI38_32300 (plasmid) [Rhodococcus oxybenzonivorans]|uniref:HTH araC/xylS-type domain-containing protein n=1 Tax=Rhodococcus oxybenzonivorans TaxID=1990687 RepID=A0A2S2C5X5_9NOCA|nr:AraC family transcriptional regulator [Rhodococcus oxybenzonivorans]AWK76188.1 hypothetical protein CBI38_32300 [Rhodococcus oxybenzonivorans]